MSDETEFVYRNENTGDIARYPYRSGRLEILPNWVTLQEPGAVDDQEPDGDPPAPSDDPPQEPGPADPPQEPAPGTGTEPPPPVVTEPASPPITGPVAVGDNRGPDTERPARSAPKGDWQAYARARAQDSDEEAAVDGLTKEQLIEQYGGDS